MKYILQEKFILTESALSWIRDPGVPHLGGDTSDLVDWAKVFQVQHPISLNGGSEYEQIKAETLWDDFFSDDGFKSTGITIAGAGENAKKLGDPFTTELVELGFKKSINPFLSFLEKTFFKNPTSYSKMPEIYPAIHNAYADHKIAEGHLTGTKNHWQTQLLRNTGIYNGLYGANEFFKLIKFIDTFAPDTKFNQLDYKSEKLKDTPPNLFELLAFLLTSKDTIDEDISVDVIKRAGKIDAQPVVNTEKEVEERFKQLVELDSTASNKKEINNIDNFTAELGIAFKRTFSEEMTLKATNGNLRGVLEAATARCATTAEEFEALAGKDGTISKKITTKPTAGFLKYTSFVLALDFNITIKNIKELLNKITA